MDSLKHRLRNAQRRIAALAARMRISQSENALLFLEQSSDCIPAYLPHVRDFRDRVMALLENTRGTQPCMAILGVYVACSTHVLIPTFRNRRSGARKRKLLKAVGL